MKVSQVISCYLVSRRSVGVRLESAERTLYQFAKTVGDCEFKRVSPKSVSKFLMGSGSISNSWYLKYKLLNGLYRYAIACGYVDKAPLPSDIPALPPSLTPHVYSTEEIQRLLDATVVINNPCCPLQASSLKSLLILLYGTGLRVSEALSLKISDINLAEKIITVRDTKFYKTRLVPLGERVSEELKHHIIRRNSLPMPDGVDSAVFAIRSGSALGYRQVNDWFVQVRNAARIGAPPGEKKPPRLHDLRHTAAVHRVIHWYRSNEDVQRLLPHLATYLGHIKIKSTQRYLTMTPELLEEASLRFAVYAEMEVDHA